MMSKYAKAPAPVGVTAPTNPITIQVKINPREFGINHVWDSDYRVPPMSLVFAKRDTPILQGFGQTPQQKKRKTGSNVNNVLCNFYGLYRDKDRTPASNLVFMGVAYDGIADSRGAQQFSDAAGRFSVVISGAVPIMCNGKDLVDCNIGDTLAWDYADAKIVFTGLPPTFSPVKIVKAATLHATSTNPWFASGLSKQCIVLDQQPDTYNLTPNSIELARELALQFARKIHTLPAGAQRTLTNNIQLDGHASAKELVGVYAQFLFSFIGEPNPENWVDYLYNPLSPFWCEEVLPSHPNSPQWLTHFLGTDVTPVVGFSPSVSLTPSPHNIQSYCGGRTLGWFTRVILPLIDASQEYNWAFSSKRARKAVAHAALGVQTHITLESRALDTVVKSTYTPAAPTTDTLISTLSTFMKTDDATVRNSLFPYFLKGSGHSTAVAIVAACAGVYKQSVNGNPSSPDMFDYNTKSQWSANICTYIATYGRTVTEFHQKRDATLRYITKTHGITVSALWLTPDSLHPIQRKSMFVGTASQFSEHTSAPPGNSASSNSSASSRSRLMKRVVKGKPKKTFLPDQEVVSDPQENVVLISKKRSAGGDSSLNPKIFRVDAQKQLAETNEALIQENQALKTSIEELEQIAAALKSDNGQQINDFQDALSAKQMEIDGHLKRIEDLESSIQGLEHDFEEELDRIQKTKNDLRSKNEIQAKQLIAENAKIKELNSTIEQLGSSYQTDLEARVSDIQNNAKKKIEELTDRLGTAIQASETQADQIQALQQSLEESEARYAQYVKESNSSAEEYENITRQYEFNEAQLQQQLQIAQAELVTVKQTILDLNDEKTELEMQMSAHKGQFQAQIKDLNAKLSVATAQLTEREQTIARLNEHATQEDARIQALTGDLATLQNTLGQANLERSALLAANEILATENQTLLSQIQTLKKQCDEYYQPQLEQLQARLGEHETQRQEFERMSGNYQQLQSQHAGLLETQLQSEQDYNTLQTNLNSIQAQLDDRNTELSSLRGEMNVLQHEKTSLEQTIRELNTKQAFEHDDARQALKNQLAEAMAELSTVNFARDNLASKMQKINDENKTLTAQIAAQKEDINALQQSQYEYAQREADLQQTIARQTTQMQEMIDQFNVVRQELVKQIQTLDASFRPPQSIIDIPVSIRDAVDAHSRKMQAKIDRLSTELKEEDSKRTQLFKLLDNLAAAFVKTSSRSRKNDTHIETYETATKAIAEMNTRLETLSASYTMFQNKEYDYDTMKNQYEEKEQTLNAEIQALLSKQQDDKQMYDLLAVRVGKLNTDLTTSKKAASKLSELNAQLNAQLQNKQTELVTLQQKIIDVEAQHAFEFENLRRTHTENIEHNSQIMRRQIEDQKREIANLRSTIEKQTRDIETVNIEKSTLESKLAKLLEDQTTLQAAQTANTVHIEKLTADIEAKNTAIQGLENVLEQKKSDLVLLETQVTLGLKAKQDLQQLQTEIAQVRNQNNALQQEKAKLSAQLVTMNDTNAKLLKQVADATAKHTELTEQLVMLQKESQTQQNELEISNRTLDSRYNNLNIDFQTLKQLSDSNSAKLASMTKEHAETVSALQTELKTLKVQVNQLQTELQTTKINLGKLNNDNANLTESKKRDEDRIQELDAQLKTTDSNLTTVKEQLVETQRELKNVRQLKDDVDVKLKEIGEEHNKLQQMQIKSKKELEQTILELRNTNNAMSLRHKQDVEALWSTMRTFFTEALKATGANLDQPMNADMNRITLIENLGAVVLDNIAALNQEAASSIPVVNNLRDQVSKLQQELTVASAAQSTKVLELAKYVSNTIQDENFYKTVQDAIDTTPLSSSAVSRMMIFRLANIVKDLNIEKKLTESTIASDKIKAQQALLKAQQEIANQAKQLQHDGDQIQAYETMLHQKTLELQQMQTQQQMYTDHLKNGTHRINTLVFDNNAHVVVTSNANNFPPAYYSMDSNELKESQLLVDSLLYLSKTDFDCVQLVNSSSFTQYKTAVELAYSYLAALNLHPEPAHADFGQSLYSLRTDFYNWCSRKMGQITDTSTEDRVFGVLLDKDTHNNTAYVLLTPSRR